MPRPAHVAVCAALAALLASVPACGSESEGSDDSDAVAEGQTVQVFQTSRAGDKLKDKGSLAVRTSDKASGTVIALSADKPRQQILGFGGALTESTAVALSVLPAQQRQEVLDAYFSPEGAGYTLARTHIASCDFSVASYQYSTMADPELSDFSIEHDKDLLLPLLKDAAATSKGALKVISAPWSAPAWMKMPAELFVKPSAENGYRGIDPRLDPQYYDAYALYLTKYIKAYQAEGVNIWGLSPQNEPLGNGGNWETMRWDVGGMRSFIGEHLGPMLEAQKLDVKLMIYDHNKGGSAVRWIDAVLNDPKAKKYIWGTAFHWYASTIKAYEDDLDAVHELDPTRALLGTEHTIDGLSDRKGAPPSAAYQDSWLKDEFYWTKTAYDWGYWWAPSGDRDDHPVYEPVYRYARDIIVGLNHWYVGWIDWNVVLDSTGGPNHQNNLCAAPIMVDAATKKVFYSPLFYVMSHFSKFIRPEAQVIETRVTLAEGFALEGYDGEATEGVLATAAKNADGSYAIVLFNQTAKPVPYTVTLDGHRAEGTIDAQALQTLIWKIAE